MNDIKIEMVSYQAAEDDICAIRIAVFQEEQGVAPELEFDGLDETAVQLLAYLGDRAVGTARMRSVGDRAAKIERLAVLPNARGKGIGRQLMQFALAELSQRSYREAIVHAQTYVQKLYLDLGFAIAGEPFFEAGIPHLKMTKLLPLLEAGSEKTTSRAIASDTK